MPNHVTHRLTFTGSASAIDAFLANHFTVDENGDHQLDFQKVVPMPASIEGTTSGSGVAVGLWLLGRTDVPTEFGGTFDAKRYLGFDWVKEAGVTDEDGLRKFMLERDPSCIDDANKAIAAYEETGYVSWYPWCINNWGTKWNAYSQNIERISDTELLVVFDTAWSPPVPIFQKLEQMNPYLALDGYCFDEGWNFACRFTTKDGEWQLDDVAPTAEIYEKVYGEAPELDDEEYEDDLEDDQIYQDENGDAA